MPRCSFIACLIGDVDCVRFFFQIADPANPQFFASPSRQTREQNVDRLLPPSADPADTNNSDENNDDDDIAQNNNNNSNNNNNYSPTNSIGESQNVELILNEAVANICLAEPNGDFIEASFRGKNSLPMCDVVILVCDSTNSPESVLAVHQQVGRAGGDAPALPAQPPILLLDFGTYYETDPHSSTVHQNPEFLDMMADLETVTRYAGSCYLDPEIAGRPGSAFESLTRMASSSVRCPRHILWDGRSLTETGRQALRRSFWLLDEDGDGLLNDSEISRWHRSMYNSFSTDDVNTVKAYARQTEASYVAAGTTHARGRLITEDTGNITVLGYLAVCHIMLAEGRHEPLWVMLSEHGVGPDALPYTDDEIERAISCEDPESMLHLSPSGISFFASLYSRQRFAHPSDLFLFTPDCPWSASYGLPNASEVDLPVHDFISCWRYMAVVEPATVTKFARYWAFGGDLATLFVESKMRPFRKSNRRATQYNNKKKRAKLITAALGGEETQEEREKRLQREERRRSRSTSTSTSTSIASEFDDFDDDEDDDDDDEIPPTAIYLVLGSPQCGKTSLMQRVADNDSGTVFADDIHPSGRTCATSTVRARMNNDGDILIAMRELDEAEVDVVLSNTRFMNTVSGILFCFDTSEPYSLSYLSRIYPLVASQANLPIVLTMCKSDLPVVDQLGLAEGPRDFCLQRNIMWPPVFTSLSHLRALPGNDLLNDVDNLTFILAEVAVNPSIVDPSCDYFGGGGIRRPMLSEDGSSNNNRGGVGFWRTVKRAFFLALIMIGLAKLAHHAWRRYQVGDRVSEVYDKTAESRRRLRHYVFTTLESSGRVLREGKETIQENAEFASTTISATLAGWASKVNEAMSLSSDSSNNQNNKTTKTTTTTKTNTNNTKATTTTTTTTKTTKTRCSSPGRTVDKEKMCEEMSFDPNKLYQPPKEGEKAPESGHHLKTRWNNSRREPQRSWARHSEWHA